MAWWDPPGGGESWAPPPGWEGTATPTPPGRCAHPGGGSLTLPPPPLPPEVLRSPPGVVVVGQREPMAGAGRGGS